MARERRQGAVPAYREGGCATPIETINVGFGNFIAAQRAVAVVRSESSPARRLVDSAARQNRLIDATSGRKARSLIVTDSHHVVVSHVQPRTIAQKLARGDFGDEDAAEAAERGTLNEDAESTGQGRT